VRTASIRRRTLKALIGGGIVPARMETGVRIVPRSIEVPDMLSVATTSDSGRIVEFLGTTDYIRWKTHCGESNGSGSGADANAAVPEPANAMMFMMGILAMCCGRRAVAS
jgi:hypothetical protein